VAVLAEELAHGDGRLVASWPFVMFPPCDCAEVIRGQSAH